MHINNYLILNTISNVVNILVFFIVIFISHYIIKIYNEFYFSNITHQQIFNKPNHKLYSKKKFKKKNHENKINNQRNVFTPKTNKDIIFIPE